MDFLRRPWHSGGAVAVGLAAQGRLAASELWLTFKPGGRLSPDTFFENKVHSWSADSGAIIMLVQ